MGYLMDILAGAVSRIVTGEVSAHAEPLARWIIRKASQRLPTTDRDKFREEWLAHLDDTPGTVRKLWHALGCYLGAAKIADVLKYQTKRKIFIVTREATDILTAAFNEGLLPRAPEEFAWAVVMTPEKIEAMPLRVISEQGIVFVTLSRRDKENFYVEGDDVFVVNRQAPTIPTPVQS